MSRVGTNVNWLLLLIKENQGTHILCTFQCHKLCHIRIFYQ